MTEPNLLTLFDAREARPTVTLDPTREHRSLITHHVRVEPARSVTWVAHLADRPAIRATGAAPYAAVCRLLSDDRLNPGLFRLAGCATCNAPNACLGDSPKGAASFAWYCGTGCLPCVR